MVDDGDIEASLGQGHTGTVAKALFATGHDGCGTSSHADSFREGRSRSCVMTESW